MWRVLLSSRKDALCDPLVVTAGRPFDPRGVGRLVGQLPRGARRGRGRGRAAAAVGATPAARRAPPCRGRVGLLARLPQLPGRGASSLPAPSSWPRVIVVARRDGTAPSSLLDDRPGLCAREWTHDQAAAPPRADGGMVRAAPPSQRPSERGPDEHTAPLHRPQVEHHLWPNLSALSCVRARLESTS